MATPVYPESSLWSFLDQRNIPWRKPTQVLESTSQRISQPPHSFLEFISLDSPFNGCKAKTLAEFSDGWPVDMPPLRWKFEIISASHQKTFADLKREFSSAFGSGSNDQLDDTLAHYWQLGMASCKVLYRPGHLNGGLADATVVLFEPDYRKPATDAEENQIHQLTYLNSTPISGLAILPGSLGDAFRFRPGLYRRLSRELPASQPLISVDSEKQVVYGVQGFLTLILPLNEIDRLELETRTGRSAVQYFLKASFKSRLGWNESDNRCLFASSKDHASILDFTKRLAQATGLPTTETEVSEGY